MLADLLRLSGSTRAYSMANPWLYRLELIQESQKFEAQSLLAEAEALMAEIGSGDYKARQAKKAADAAKQAEAGLATQGLKLRCDVNGCVIVPMNASQSTPGLTGNIEIACPPMAFTLTCN